MLRTAECVTPKHPDKLCDRISDTILDECLKQDPKTRAAIETMGGHGIITITGELTTEAYVDMREIAQSVAGEQYGVQVNVVQQSPEIAQGVDKDGAGDQGIMVGYACRENDSYIPQEAYLARSLCQHIYNIYKKDGKTQITLEGDTIKSIVASFANATREQLLDKVIEWCEELSHDADKIDIHINSAGDWNISGFEADTGLTGRKIVVDAYGPRVPVGGGAFSGKDATKVDRSGAYLARHLAVKTLKERKAREVYCYLAYAIGYSYPVQATLVIDGEEEYLTDLSKYTPSAIIKQFNLDQPIFSKTAEWGHFGNNFNWDHA